MLMSNEEIATLKGYLKNRVAYARYYSGGKWYKTNVPDGRFAVYILFGHDAPNQISKIEFYNVDGGIFASGTESINKESFSEGILYRYTIAIKQTTD